MEGYHGNSSQGLVLGDLGDLKVQVGTLRVKAVSGGRPGGGEMQRRGRPGLLGNRGRWFRSGEGVMP